MNWAMQGKRAVRMSRAHSLSTARKETNEEWSVGLRNEAASEREKAGLGEPTTPLEGGKAACIS